MDPSVLLDASARWELRRDYSARGPYVSLCVRETLLTSRNDISRTSGSGGKLKISHQFPRLAQEKMVYGRNKAVPPPSTPFEEFMATTSERMIAAKIDFIEFLRELPPAASTRPRPPPKSKLPRRSTRRRAS